MDPTTILFDAGNTLVFIDPQVVLPILQRHGALRADAASFWKAEVDARIRLTERIGGEGRDHDDSEIWKEYFGNLFLGCGLPPEELEEAGKAVVAEHAKSHIWSHMDPSTPPALRVLEEAGYRMAVVSNADGRMESLIEGVGIRDFFEFVMDSEVEGVAKPDPEIFLRAATRMGADPGECLYVGDLYPVDVLGARGVGMDAVLMDPMDRMDYPVDRLRRVADLPAYLGVSEAVG
jgi:putative hydrolase of the HAD superfamily